jgi:hypothetical protein
MINVLFFCEVRFTPRSKINLEKLIVVHLAKNSPRLKELIGSLPYSKEPATCPCLEPNNPVPVSNVIIKNVYIHCIAGYYRM